MTKEVSEERQVHHHGKDYVDPPPTPLLDLGELKLWSFYRALIAEFIATLLFLYVTVATVIGHKKLNNVDQCDGVGLLGIAWAFGGMIFILVYCTAGISGGHINPAVTFGLFLARKVSLFRALGYMVAQCLGAICGVGLVKAFMKSFYNDLGGGANSVAIGYNKGTALGAEIIGTFVLVYTVFSATDPKRNARDSHVPVLAPLPIGFAVFMVHLATIPITGTGINPARSFGAAVIFNNEKVWDDHVTEDQQVIDFVRAQCNTFLEQQVMSNSGATNSSFSLSANGIQVFPEPLKENLDLPHDISIEKIHLCNSPMNNANLQHFSGTGETGNTSNNILFEGTYVSNPFAPSIENGFQEMQTLQGNIFGSQVKDNDSFTRENNRSDDSDPNDDEEDAAKYGRRTGKGPQCKNLMAERKRRKKLNDRLYNLRALVPNISKLDRASILGDAIDYVKELKKQVEELQIELEEHSDDEDARKTSGTNSNDNNVQPGVMYHAGMKRAAKCEQEKYLKVSHRGPSANVGISILKQEHNSENTNEKLQLQMEPQVEVFQLEGNELFVKIFCEHKPGGFVNLLEALNSLGLEITNVNTTRHTCLVSNIFKVEKRDSETIQANHVRESLLALTRNPSRMWAEIKKTMENGNIDHDYHHHHLHQDYNDRSLHNNNHQMNPHPLQRLHH